ncbi:MAG: VOC family protein [Vicinamibacterales bacterium]
MAHPVMWFEVIGNDGPRLQAFYGALFDWQGKDAPAAPGYRTFDPPEGKGIPGGIGQPYPGIGRSWVTFYVGTPDVAASLERAVGLGGKVVLQRTVLPDVTLGLFEDPEGHVVGLVEAT